MTNKKSKFAALSFFCVDSRIFSFGLKPRDLAVYFCLCSHKNVKTGVAFPSRSTIAKECGISKVDTVDKAIKTLWLKGLITKKPQYRPDGGFSSNVYTITEKEDMGGWNIG